MANLVRNFVKGRMNKSVDERLVPNGEYIDALNIRMGSTEESEVGAIENTLGNTQLTTLTFIDGTPLSAQATCIGSYADSANEVIYWFVHDPDFTVGPTGNLDLVVSYNVVTDVITYHVVSINNGNAFNTTLNFDPQYLITGVDLIDDLLFFTDNLNEPRRINIGQNYNNPTLVGGVWTDDPLLEEDIAVIKRPPTAPPTIETLNNGAEENFMEERFLCFAYRYRYSNGEYSATSQFTQPAFVAGQFAFSTDGYLNEGMVNAINTCEVTYNSGSELVVGIDLLFKEMDDNVIRVIEKIDKTVAGLNNNEEYTYSFKNNQIFTILPESEILRLYDNVPRFAKAQSVMGNRLFYGNYVEGYDMVDGNGNAVQVGFSTELINREVGSFELPVTLEQGTYTYNGNVNVPLSVMRVGFGQVLGRFNAGAVIRFDVELSHSQYNTAGGATSPVTTSGDIDVSWTYVLSEDYSNLIDFFTSSDFLEKVGAVDATLNSVGTACEDVDIWSNLFNCNVADTQAGGVPTPVDQANSGISGDDQPILVQNPNEFQLTVQFPATKYTNGAAQVFEYYTIKSASVSFRSIATPKSLHSNRNYELGIVYMDEFGRSNTPLVSSNSLNSVHVPCGDSVFANNIRATIPTYQLPPVWASSYKFVIKPDREGYETIYSNIFLNDPNTNYTFCLLEGENAAKVQDGDRYIVKSDTQGATPTCVYTTVLDKVVKEANFLGDDNPSPAGTYMRVYANNFSAVQAPNATILPGWKAVDNDDNSLDGYNAFDYEYPILEYTGFGTSGNNNPLDIPGGSRIRIQMEFTRQGRGDGNANCERRELFFDETFVADEDYANIIDWFYNQDGVVYSIENTEGFAGDNEITPTNQVLPLITEIVTGENQLYGISPSLAVNKMRWYQNPNNASDIRFVCTGTKKCGSLFPSDNRRSKIRVRFEIFRSDSLLVFETMPQDSLPDLWYESSESFPITNGFHRGNVQSQTATEPGIIDTDFFNCIAFGNGVESYKIRDSITGKPITLGNRVTTTSSQEYREIRRFADITYSGIYNDESNVNKLNEFNLGLLNFKPLEDRYGPVEKMFGRKTDILTLQEDKISYVLAGKNLLTDSTGGSVVTSVPEVLGTQVARTEDYGISNNPESFAEWGPHKFFTDAKRGAVIHLFGDGTNESLEVVSESGMRSWFRDMFIADFNTQKLGGYDPYMDEYVLANNEIALPGFDVPLPCGITQTFLVTNAGVDYSVELGALIGTVEVRWEVIEAAPGEAVEISTNYNGTVQSSGSVSTGGNYFVQKNNLLATTVDVNITFSGSDRFVLSLTIECVDAEELTVRLITLTNDEDSGQTIHHEYRWADGTYVSPTNVSPLKFLSSTQVPVVSQYSEVFGFQGQGYIPTDDATITMASNRIFPDNFVLDTAVDRFYYLRTNVDYGNNLPDIIALKNAALPVGGITPLGGPQYYYANFPMSATGTGEYLYLIWDYQQNKEFPLCYSNVKLEDACCDCICDQNNCQEYAITNDDPNNVSFVYTVCGTATSAYFTVPSRTTLTICSDTLPAIILGNQCNITMTILDCDC